MLLSDAVAGKEYVVKVFLWPGKRMRRRLYDLGLTTDCGFKVITNSVSGPVLVEVRGTRQAIGKGMAMKIEVEEVE